MAARRRVASRFFALTSLSALAIGSLVGCGSAPEPAPTPTPVFVSEAQAFAAAEDVYRAYNDALNSIDPSDPETFEPVFELSSGAFEKADRKNLSILHAERHSIAGDAVVLSFTGYSASPQYQTVTARICLDVSAVQITDENGASVVAPDRPEVYALDVTFELQDDQFSIDAAERSEESTCEGS